MEDFDVNIFLQSTGGISIEIRDISTSDSITITADSLEGIKSFIRSGMAFTEKVQSYINELLPKS